MKHGWWLVLLWLPTVAQAWEEEPALGRAIVERDIDIH